VKTGNYGDVTGQGAQKGIDPANLGTPTATQMYGEADTYVLAAKILGAPQTAVAKTPLPIFKV